MKDLLTFGDTTLCDKVSTVSDLPQFGDFLLFPPPIKLTTTYKENVQVTLHSLKIMEPMGGF
jgi:hypothetical protein